MTVYEYQVLQATTLINEDQLDELGTQGWMLISILKDSDPPYFYYFYFMRETGQPS